MALIVSDLGGVLVRLEADRCHRCWSSLSGLPVEEVRRRLFPDPVYEALERGEVSTEQYMAHVRSELGADIDDETLTDCFTDIYLGLDTGVLAALARFRDEGHRLVALTNTNRSHHDRWRPIYREPLAVFDDIHLSFELGARKPETACFQAVLAAEETPAHQTVFIDDALGHVEAARKFGMAAIHHTGPEQLLGDLKALLQRPDSDQLSEPRRPL